MLILKFRNNIHCPLEDDTTQVTSISCRCPSSWRVLRPPKVPPPDSCFSPPDKLVPLAWPSWTGYKADLKKIVQQPTIALCLLSFAQACFQQHILSFTLYDFFPWSHYSPTSFLYSFTLFLFRWLFFIGISGCCVPLMFGTCMFVGARVRVIFNLIHLASLTFTSLSSPCRYDQLIT